MKTLFIGDTHFSHQNILEADARPFASVEEMDAHLVARWNSVVEPGDLVYVMGDFAWANSAARERMVLPTLKRLKGNLFLIRGNHDHLITSEYRGLFCDVRDYLVTEVDGHKCVLFHFPIAAYWHQTHGALHIHAHTHNRPLPCSIPGSVCVSACRPYMNYTPRTLQQLLPYVTKGSASS